MLRRLLLLTSLFFFALVAAQAQTTLTAAQLQNGQALELNKLSWKYSPNDEPRFADPQFDDGVWAIVSDWKRPHENNANIGWSGFGWFRLHINAAPELVGVPINLELIHLGASEIYVDGKQVGRFGVVGKTEAEEVAFNPSALPLAITFQPVTEHVIAVRYSNQQAANVNSFLSKWQIAWGVGVGFSGRLKQFDASTNQGVENTFGLSYNLFQGAFALALGILHFWLFVFLRQQRANLFYSIFLLGLACNNFLANLTFTNHFSIRGYYFLQVVTALIEYPYPVALLAFVYVAFEQRIPRRIWLFLAGAGIVVFFLAFHPGTFETLINGGVNLALSLETLRVIYKAIRQQRDGAWLVGIGLAFYFVRAVRSFLFATVGFQALGFGVIVMDVISWYGLMLTISIHLAREFAKTNYNLEEQLVQVKQLSAAALEHEKVKAENERRAKELEEARQLQLSMLPKKLPQLPHLEIAAYMKTASEVGGDYYDFHLGEDGTLTIAVGDATGHGLKAGTLVSSVKSLVVSLAYHPDIPYIFQRMSSVLKEMNLRGLFMAMTMVKVKGHQMSVSIAGMPSVLIYRASSGTVEEVAMRALPLGGMAKYEYKQQEFTLAANDVVVLMSDGLPERFNPQGEMLAEEAAKQYLAQHAQASAQQLIEGLAKLGDDWGGVRPQDDDVTFVVLKRQ